MFDVNMVAGTGFWPSYVDWLLLPQFVLSVFYVLIHVANLMQQAQQGHIHSLGYVADT